ncbi:hypothetical protein RND71_033653 [Anisodus tanguticus]|uniref:Uncharacterized protein n=1 Tax=Anisodus tanguticus TaxID=243964 RepID=A0AAE1R9R5_9SOLA|nr:hypothetical protein RND71_033653 [Anisodus tanguticus]
MVATDNSESEYVQSRGQINRKCYLFHKKKNSLLAGTHHILLRGRSLGVIRKFVPAYPGYNNYRTSSEEWRSYNNIGLQRKGLSLGDVPPRRRSRESLPSGF